MFNDRASGHHIDECSFWERSYSAFSLMFSIDILFLALLTGLSGFQSRESGFWGRPFRALADSPRQRHTLDMAGEGLKQELEGVDGGLRGRQWPLPVNMTDEDRKGRVRCHSFLSVSLAPHT